MYIIGLSASFVVMVRFYFISVVYRNIERNHSQCKTNVAEI